MRGTLTGPVFLDLQQYVSWAVVYIYQGMFQLPCALVENPLIGDDELKRPYVDLCDCSLLEPSSSPNDYGLA